MLHVLRLSYLGVAKVQGPKGPFILLRPVWILAELKILKFQSVADLETQMNVFEGDGTLMLVTDLPPFAQSLLGPIA
jgi:hypothetical protein